VNRVNLHVSVGAFLCVPWSVFAFLRANIARGGGEMQIKRNPVAGTGARVSN
jgi:hypothetical protein